MLQQHNSQEPKKRMQPTPKLTLYIMYFYNLIGCMFWLEYVTEIKGSGPDCPAGGAFTFNENGVIVLNCLYFSVISVRSKSKLAE